MTVTFDIPEWVLEVPTWGWITAAVVVWYILAALVIRRLSANPFSGFRINKLYVAGDSAAVFLAFLFSPIWMPVAGLIFTVFKPLIDFMGRAER